MTQWWSKRLPICGFVLFRGDLPFRPADFAFLETRGISARPARDSTGATWSLDFVHPEWGRAQLGYIQDASLPPREVFDFAFIPQSDRDAAISARRMVGVKMSPTHNHMLRDRKLLLRFLNAVMAQDGVVVLDMLSEKVWTREELDDELCHNADLDVEGILNIHAVTNEAGRTYWLHTHGLSEIGVFDFDIFDPCKENLGSTIHELVRAVAFRILDGELSPSTPDFLLFSPGGHVMMVEMRRFLKGVEPGRRAVFESYVQETHRDGRSVLCEPEEGILRAIVGGRSLKPASALMNSLPDNSVFPFSTTASNLMAERARNTYSLFRSLAEEFASFDFPILVKLGIPVGAANSAPKEHMWF